MVRVSSYVYRKSNQLVSFFYKLFQRMIFHDRCFQLFQVILPVALRAADLPVASKILDS